MTRCYDGQFQWQQHTGNELIEEDRFILSRTNVAVDGNFKCIITVDQKSGLELIIFGPRHVPYDIEEGHWHGVRQSFLRVGPLKRITPTFKQQYMHLCYEYLLNKELEIFPHRDTKPAKKKHDAPLSVFSKCI